jgi:hypothetical protein
MVSRSATEKQWAIFLCYSERDQVFAEWLYKKLSAAGLRVWYDKKEITVGDSIPAHVSEGLRGSKLLIAVISEWALISHWVQNELEAKIIQQINTQKTLIMTIILEDANPANLPSLLAARRWIEFPRNGSDEQFNELLVGIRKHLLPQEAESVQENPFTLQGGVAPKDFVVPEPLMRKVARDIANKRSIAIIGASMMGKTSFLKFLASPYWWYYYYQQSGAGSEPQCVYLNIQEHLNRNCAQLLSEVANAISNSPTVKKKFPKKDHGKYDETLKWIKDTVGQDRARMPFWVLLFDSFDRINELKDIGSSIFDQIKILSQDYNMCFVIASRKSLENVSLPFGIGTSDFITLLRKHSLKVWDQFTAHKLMFEPRGITLEEFNQADYDYILRLTASHPLLLQMACYHLFEIRYVEKKEAGQYNQLLERYIEEARDVYSYYLNNEISDVEKSWLNALQEALFRKGRNAREKLRSLSIERENRNIRKRLAELGLVLDKSGPLVFPEGLREFLERNETV